MSKQLTPEQEEFIKVTLAHRKEKVEQLAYQALALSLKADIPIFELPYYVLQRTKAILEEAFHLVNFDNKKLKELQKKFLKECLIEMKSKIVIPEKKEEKDLTDKRDNQCEPISQAIANMLLDPELIFSDDNYFDKVLTEEANIPLFSCIFGYDNSLEEKITQVISEHFRRAQKRQWGVEREDITFSMLDDVLKDKFVLTIPKGE